MSRQPVPFENLSKIASPTNDGFKNVSAQSKIFDHLKIDEDTMEFPPLKFRSKLKSFDDRECTVPIRPKCCLDEAIHESSPQTASDF